MRFFSLKKLLQLSLLVSLTVFLCVFAHRSMLHISSVRGASPASLLEVHQESDNHMAFQWDKVEIEIIGPNLDATQGENPFAKNVDVIFTAPNSTTFRVPAFFNGNNQGQNQGNKWVARFAPPQIGEWTYEVVASESGFSSRNGSFNVEPAYGDGLFNKGKLAYSGEPYLRFKNGDYFLKAGADDPENLLGGAFGDFVGKREYVDYLSNLGINSIYILLQNIDGDYDDTWPWLGKSNAEAKNNGEAGRFDISKLDEWEEFFRYANSNGMVVHLLFNDDSAWNDYNEDLYIREMIARFSYLPGVIWNVGEEANEIFSDTEQLNFAEKINQIDPYDTPVTVHRVHWENSDWPFLGNPVFNLTSMQTDGALDIRANIPENLNTEIIEALTISRNLGYIQPANYDELQAIRDNSESTRDIWRTRAVWPVLMAGGGLEVHFFDIEPRQLGSMWSDTAHAKRFIEGFDDWHTLQASNDLVTASQGRDFAFTTEKGDIGIYLDSGGGASLTIPEGRYSLRWFNPETGSYTDELSISGGQVSITSPSSNGDYAAAITSVIASTDNSASIVMSPHTIELLTLPDSGTSTFLDPNQTIFGGFGNDRLVGGEGNDTLYGNEGNDKLLAGDGDDLLIGGLGRDYLNGETGNDRILGNKGSDKLFGGAGDDILDGGIGRNRYWGGSGDDIFVLNRNGLALIFDFEQGIDKLAASGINDNIFIGRMIRLSQWGRHTLIHSGNQLIGILGLTDREQVRRADFGSDAELLNTN
jgi:hypothetical protein